MTILRNLYKHITYAKWDKNEKILPSLHSEKFQEITNLLVFEANQGRVCIKNGRKH